MKSRFAELGYWTATPDCHPELDRGQDYHRMSYGAGSLSYEEACFLYGLVMVCKPARVLETGTETGASLYHLALALRDTGGGHVLSVDNSEVNVRAANEELRRLELSEYGAAVCADAADFIEGLAAGPVASQFEMAFLDTSIPLRIGELRQLEVLGLLRPGALVVLHDTSPAHPMGDMRIREELGEARLIHLPSPRGISVYQAP